MSDATKKSLSTEERMQVFNREFAPHTDSMYSFAYRLTGDDEDAKDLVQDTYMKSYRFIDSFEEGTNAKAWLFRILKNSFINEYRRKSKEPSKIDYQEVETIYNGEKNDPAMISGIRLENTKYKIGDEVTGALNALAVDFRIVIILCDLEGFTYEEMSKILDIPIGTVRSRLHRARNLLKEKLETYAKKMGYSQKKAN
ncbi:MULTISPECIES: sigma-70 family RNA polymerase sigma factor [Flammeovirga]|uniref:Sigma-70 family RNA polymerase sigma factor n=1 Tax=Flammeovirga agarivorans TaxID=2726742 RepID=A0A7X8SM86_9BACT|nr:MULTISPECIES: sigma-70 family RNA polymerase sigma factor [Flammeovirga]NLR92819.1 sigma-70 family RNA polymerase sigma factor [Flammeovirga agarivorans]